MRPYMQCVLSACPPTGPNVPPTRSGDQWLYVDADEVGTMRWGASPFEGEQQ